VAKFDTLFANLFYETIGAMHWLPSLQLTFKICFCKVLSQKSIKKSCFVGSC